MLKIFTLKKYITQYKPFLLFLGKFFLTYLLLTFIYQFYLIKDSGNVDKLTTIVAKNTVQVLNLFDNASLETTKIDEFIKLFYKETYIVRIVEGCNSISVIILFISFVIAFSGKRKQTFFFIFRGSLIIYILNIFRIALLCHLLYHFPNQQVLFHSIIFPLIIYGTVFILWIIWVNKYSKYATKVT